MTFHRDGEIGWRDYSSLPGDWHPNKPYSWGPQEPKYKQEPDYKQRLTEIKLRDQMKAELRARLENELRTQIERELRDAIAKNIDEADYGPVNNTSVRWVVRQAVSIARGSK